MGIIQTLMKQRGRENFINECIEKYKNRPIEIKLRKKRKSNIR